MLALGSDRLLDPWPLPHGPLPLGEKQAESEEEASDSPADKAIAQCMSMAFSGLWFGGMHVFMPTK